MPDGYATSNRAGTFFDGKHRVLPVPGVSPPFEWLFEGDGAIHRTSIPVSTLQAGWRDAPANDPRRQEKVDSRTLKKHILVHLFYRNNVDDAVLSAVLNTTHFGNLTERVAFHRRTLLTAKSKTQGHMIGLAEDRKLG
jgi:hypothetical protein